MPSASIDNHLQKRQARALLTAIEQGIPLVAQPYLQLAQQVGLSEQQVIELIQAWQGSGLIRRFGLVVRHRQLGYHANAMVVWNITDEKVANIARRLAAQNAVTLCYRRPRVLPHWPYNLFCMIHGKNREQVLAQLDSICQQLELSTIEKDILFSTKAYKQQGGRYAANPV